MKKRVGMLGATFAMSLMGSLGIAAAAHADTTCYTGCKTPAVEQSNHATTAVNDGSTSSSGTSATSDGGGLPFTGADIAGMTIVGVGAVGLGTFLVQRNRRTASENTSGA